MAKMTDRVAYPFAAPVRTDYLMFVDASDTTQSAEGSARAVRMYDLPGGDVVTPEDYGYTDESADVVPYLQAILDAVPAQATVQDAGVKIKLRADKRYTWATNLSILKHNVTLDFNGAAAISTMATGDNLSAGAIDTQVHGLQILNPTFFQDSETERTAGRFFHFRQCVRGRISNANIDGWYDGIEVQGCARFTLDQVYGTGRNRTTKARHMMRVMGDPSSGLLTACTNIDILYPESLDNNSVDGAGEGFAERFLYAEAVDWLSMIGGHANNYDIPIDLNGQSAGGDRMREIMVHNFYCDRNYERAIWIRGDGTDYTNIQFIGGEVRTSEVESMFLVEAPTVGLVVMGVKLRQAYERAFDQTNQNSHGTKFIGNTLEGNNTNATADISETRFGGEGHVIDGNTTTGGSGSNTVFCRLRMTSENCYFGAGNTLSVDTNHASKVSDGGSANILAPSKAAFVADASAGSAAEINALRDALVTAGLMAAS